MTEIRYGYTLAELDILVRRAVLRNVWYQQLDMDERYAAGWHAAVELLYVSEQPPPPHTLTAAAWSAADHCSSSAAEGRGVPRKRGDSYIGRTDMPRFHAYWFKRVTGAVDDPVVERLALQQIWPLLKPEHQEALTALAAYGSYSAAADSLGLKYKNYCFRVARARERFIGLWLEGETPGPRWMDRRRRSEGPAKSLSARIKRRAREAAAAEGGTA